MHVLLHMGQSKTGTSAIQAYLTLNRAPLREASVLYPCVRIGGMPVDLGNHNTVADALVGWSRFPNLTVEEYFDQFFRAARQVDAKLMILSAEHFFGGAPRIWDVPDEQTYFQLYRKKIEVLERHLVGHEVTLLVYLRPQVDWLASAISQTVRTERLITNNQIIYQDDQQFFEMAKPMLRYCTLVDTWVNTLHPQEMLVIPYERELLHKNSSIADFLYRAGLEDLHLPFGEEALQSNPSLSREYIEVKKRLNRTTKSKTEERVIISCLELLSAQSDRGTSYQLSSDLIREIEEFVAPENERLNACYIRNSGTVKSRSHATQFAEIGAINENDIAVAWAAFEKEYARPRTRLLMVDCILRAFLRKHAKPVHSVLHQLKRAYRSYIYRK